jgi:hypothetical protein
MLRRGRGRATYRVEHLSVQLRPGRGQAPPTVVALLDGLVQQATYRGSIAQLASRTKPARFRQTLYLEQRGARFLVVGSPGLHAAARAASVARRVEDDFRFGMWNDVHAADEHPGRPHHHRLG